MNLARVIGRATATSRHPSMAGWKLLVVQPLDASGGADGVPQLAVDALGSGRGDTVLITSDGKAARELLKSDQTPVRWTVMGLADDN